MKKISEKNIQTARERALIQSAIEGNETAYTKLFNENFPTVLTRIKGMLKDDIEAEDITMTAFESVFLKYLRTGNYNFEAGYKFSSFVSVIAKNRMIDKIRIKKNKPTALSISTGNVSEKTGELIYAVQVEDVNAQTESNINYSELMAFILEQREELWAKRQIDFVNMLDLRILQGYSEGDAAKKLNRSVQSIKSNSHSLRVYLREAIKNQFHDYNFTQKDCAENE